MRNIVPIWGQLFSILFDGRVLLYLIFDGNCKKFEILPTDFVGLRIYYIYKSHLRSTLALNIWILKSNLYSLFTYLRERGYTYHNFKIFYYVIL